MTTDDRWHTGFMKAPRMHRMPDVVGDYPLEAGLAVWGFFIGAITLIDLPPSGALAALPGNLDRAWGVAMTIGAISVVFGLLRRQISPAIANAMVLFAVVFAVYAIAVLQRTGFAQGGAVAGLTAMLAAVCFLRARRLRLLWKVLLQEANRLEGVDRDAAP